MRYIIQTEDTIMNNYTNEDLTILLNELLAYPTEQTWLEFKKDNTDPERIGKYASALSNCASAANQRYGYLIWGIDDKTHQIVGTSFDPDTAKKNNQNLKLWLHTQLRPEISFEFFKFPVNNVQVVIMEVEAAYRQPIAFSGTAWARIGESLVELSTLPRISEQIYRTVGKDWSGEIVLRATCDDLDRKAIDFARMQFAEKHKDDSFFPEIETWDDITFLNKAKLAINGKLTRAAIILLGKPESVHFLDGAAAKITWKLLDSEGNDIDYKHFEPPFLLTVDSVFSKIRNITIRTMPDGTLFPVEISQYDRWVFREALHNCIAHSDYAMRCSIVVSEYPDHLQFSNAGAFLPGSVENVLHDNGRPRFYPNKQLTEAMTELKMIDTIGSGIRRMFLTQKKRFMPMPDYIIDGNEVRVILQGKVLDERYTRLLMRQPDLALDDIILLDILQKNGQISKEAADNLRKKKLIEGRYPKVYPAENVAISTGKLDEYLDNKAYDDAFYIQKILEFLCKKGQASRQDITQLIKKHLSPLLTDEQKNKKIGNLISTKMSSKLHFVTNIGTRKAPSWVITEEGMAACKSAHPDCKKDCRKR